MQPLVIVIEQQLFKKGVLVCVKDMLISMLSDISASKAMIQ